MRHNNTFAIGDAHKKLFFRTNNDKDDTRVERFIDNEENDRQHIGEVQKLSSNA